MSLLPKDWDGLDRILTDWAMYERWGLTSNDRPAGIGGSVGVADDLQQQWGRLRVQEALSGFEPRRAHNVRDLALRAYTDRPQLLRDPVIVELRGILHVLVEAKRFLLVEMAA